MPIKLLLEAIKFNHDSASATGDAFNIRKNESERVPFPEWQRGKSFTAEDSLAAYAIEQTRGKSISIRAKFKRSDPALNTIEVQAVDASPPLGVRNILGRAEKATVTFGANGESDFVEFLLKDVRLEERGVGISKNVWRWQFRGPADSKWTNFAKTAHKIYSVLDVPQGPWSQDVSGGDNTQLPWAEVLDVACDWAASAQNFPQAAELITRNTYDLGLGLVGYQGSPAVYALANFECTDFLKLLRGQAGMGKRINCSDCATIVSTLANLLGCQTFQVKFDREFETNPIILISESSHNPTFFQGHEVAWTGDTPAEGAVFDACLQVDGDDEPKDPSEFTGLLPANLKFVANEPGYRFRLSSGDNIAPLLNLKQRRRIGNRIDAILVELDPMFLKILEQRFNYEEWRSPSFSETSQPTVLPLSISGLLEDWVEVNRRSQKFVDGTKLQTLLFSPVSSDPDMLLREDLFECANSQTARSLLLRLLGEYKSTKVKRLESPIFADVAFLATDNSSLVFALSRWVVLVRSVGTNCTSRDYNFMTLYSGKKATSTVKTNVR